MTIAMTFLVTVSHSSISDAREIQMHGTIAAVKRKATSEFGGGFNDHRIVIADLRGETVSSRRIGDKRWDDAGSTVEQAKWSRANEVKRVAAGGRRIPGGILPADASDALAKLQKSGYASSATACIARALVAAAQ